MSNVVKLTVEINRFGPNQYSLSKSSTSNLNVKVLEEKFKKAIYEHQSSYVVSCLWALLSAAGEKFLVKNSLCKFVSADVKKNTLELSCLLTEDQFNNILKLMESFDDLSTWESEITIKCEVSSYNMRVISVLALQESRFLLSYHNLLDINKDGFYTYFKNPLENVIDSQDFIDFCYVCETTDYTKSKAPELIKAAQDTLIKLIK